MGHQVDAAVVVFVAVMAVGLGMVDDFVASTVTAVVVQMAGQVVAAVVDLLVLD